MALCYDPKGLSRGLRAFGSRRGLSALPIDSIHKCWNSSDDRTVMNPLVWKVKSWKNLFQYHKVGILVLFRL